MPLTDLKCRSAKPTEKDYKLSDQGRLYLLVRPNGSKLWRMNYSYGGKQKTLAIGAYPAVSLADARVVRDEAKEQLASGIDPKLRGVSDPDKTVKAIANEWWEIRKAQWKPDYANTVMTRLRQRVLPTIGEMEIEKVEPAHVLVLIRQIEAQKRFDLSRRVRQYISDIYAYAIASGYAKFDPAASLVPAMAPKPKTKHRRALPEEDLPVFFRRLSEYQGDPQTRLAIEFVTHTFTRSIEFRDAQWSEFDFERRLWRIPKERMKHKKEHLVPLSDHVMKLLVEVKAVAGNSKWLFPSEVNEDDSISGNTLLYSLYRMGYHSKATVHGFRTVASTILNESGLWRADVIEMQLSHVEEDDVRGSYNAALYLPERVNMMNWYSEYLIKAASKKVEDRDRLLEGLL